MHKRKTDDNKILQLLNEGKTQKEIAEYFNVSPVAIHKRVKRICPPDLPNFNELTEKEQTFCVEIAKGKTQTQAAMNSFEVSSMESAKVIGSQLMSRDKIKLSLEELMEHHGLTKSFRVQKLKTHVENRDPNVSLKALDQSWKLDGSYAPEKHLNVGISIQDILEERKQVSKQIKELQEDRKKALNKIVTDNRNKGIDENVIIDKLLEYYDESNEDGNGKD